MDLYSKYINDLPRTPQECDYYFETVDDFKAKRDQILLENNNDLSEKTIGFSDDVIDLSLIFKNTNIVSTPKMIFARNATEFIYSFQYCYSLKNVSGKLFSNCPNATNFRGTFSSSSLTELPKELFFNCTNATEFSMCFESCDFTSIPVELFSKNILANNFKDCFTYIDELTTVPFELFDNNTNATIFGGCFSLCKEITSAIPDAWNKEKFPNVTEYSEYAKGCTKAANYADIPEDWK